MGLHVPFQLTTAAAAARDLARPQRWPDVNRIAMFTSHQTRYFLHGQSP
jgi:hypothetical protein